MIRESNTEKDQESGSSVLIYFLVWNGTKSSHKIESKECIIQRYLRFVITSAESHLETKETLFLSTVIFKETPSFYCGANYFKGENFF